MTSTAVEHLVAEVEEEYAFNCALPTTLVSLRP